MRNAPIVQGVPTQYKLHVHPYPTRFHGANYTRPVFGMPVIARPAQVFTPGYDIDREVPQSTLSGLGAVNSRWNAGDGVFGPGGYGGGVFDGNISGLGSLGAGRLGALSTPDGEYPWGTKSDKTTVLQSMLNAYLLRYGMCPIAVDGKLGGATCGALKMVGDKEGQDISDGPPECFKRQSAWIIPKKNAGTGSCGAGVPGPSSTTAPAPITQNPLLESGMSSSTKRALGFALGGALAIGAVLVLRKKR